MSFILHADSTLRVAAIRTANDKFDLTEYYAYAFSYPEAVIPGQRVPDDAVCTRDKRETSRSDLTGETAAQVREATGITV